MAGDRPAAGIAWMLVAVLLFTVLDSLAKLLVAGHPVALVLWGRYLFNALWLAVLLGPTVGPRRVLATRRPGLQVARGIFLVGATGFMFASVRFLPLADTYAVSFVAPLLVAVFAGIVLAERLRRVQWLAVLAGFGGVLIVVRPGFAAGGWPYLLPLGMAACYAAFQVLTRYMGSADRQATTLFYTAGVGTLAASALVPFFWTPLPPTVWAALALMGAIGMVAQLCLIRAYRRAPASLLAPLTYSQVVWGSLIGLVVFGDAPDAPTLAGAGVIVASGLLLVWTRESGGPAAQ